MYVNATSIRLLSGMFTPKILIVIAKREALIANRILKSDWRLALSASRLSLSLFMFWILADDINPALPLHGLAAGTNFLNGGSDFHGFRNFQFPIFNFQ